jgi:transglutaminase-like putative cysteine protease
MRSFVWMPIFLATATLVYPGEINPTRLSTAGDNAPALRGFAEVATREFGQPGARAAAFLFAGMPDTDLRSLSKEFLLENLSLAFRARQEFPWAREVPEDLFLDFILPYAQLDEPRDPWRSDFHRRCRVIVKDCKTASEAAMAINTTLFQQLGVKYDTGRKRPNQSPKESIEQGKASCTGLSIILADACRSVGIPARLAGIAKWTHKQGNHTWVEVWDGSWHFAGAAEPSPDGLDHGWFQGDASQAVRDQPANAIWANAWAPTQNHFPLAWDPSNTRVPAVNVTEHYAVKPAGLTERGAAILHLRVLDDQGQRIVARVGLLDSDGKILRSVTTKAGTADLNDMPALELKPGGPVTLRVEQGVQARDFPITARDAGVSTLDLNWSKGTPVKAGTK